MDAEAEEGVCQYLAPVADSVQTDVCRPVVWANHSLTSNSSVPHGLPIRPCSIQAYVALSTGHLLWTSNPFAAEIHASARRNALSKFTMPAMSPTMTEGGIAQWKLKEGQKYSAGDVLLEIVRILFFALRLVPLTFHTRKLTRPLLTWRRRKMVFSQKLW